MSANIQYDLEQLKQETLTLLGTSKKSITSCLIAYHGSKFTVEKGDVSRKTDSMFGASVTLTDKEIKLWSKIKSINDDIKQIPDTDAKIKTSPIDVATISTAFQEIQYYSAAVTNFKVNELSKLKRDTAALDVKHLDKEALIAAKKDIEADANEKLAIARYWISKLAVLLYMKNHPKFKSKVNEIDIKLEEARKELSAILQTPRFDKHETSKVSATASGQQTITAQRQISSHSSSQSHIPSVQPSRPQK